MKTLEKTFGIPHQGIELFKEYQINEGDVPRSYGLIFTTANDLVRQLEGSTSIWVCTSKNTNLEVYSNHGYTLLIHMNKEGKASFGVRKGKPLEEVI